MWGEEGVSEVSPVGIGVGQSREGLDCSPDSVDLTGHSETWVPSQRVWIWEALRMAVAQDIEAPLG